MSYREVDTEARSAGLIDRILGDEPIVRRFWIRLAYTNCSTLAARTNAANCLDHFDRDVRLQARAIMSRTAPEHARINIPDTEALAAWRSLGMPFPPPSATIPRSVFRPEVRSC